MGKNAVACCASLAVEFAEKKLCACCVVVAVESAEVMYVRVYRRVELHKGAPTC